MCFRNCLSHQAVAVLALVVLPVRLHCTLCRGVPSGLFSSLLLEVSRGPTRMCCRFMLGSPQPFEISDASRLLAKYGKVVGMSRGPEIYVNTIYTSFFLGGLVGSAVLDACLQSSQVINTGLIECSLPLSKRTLLLGQTKVWGLYNANGRTFYQTC